MKNPGLKALFFPVVNSHKSHAMGSPKRSTDAHRGRQTDGRKATPLAQIWWTRATLKIVLGHTEKGWTYVHAQTYIIHVIHIYANGLVTVAQIHIR
jgi:hypothetical protein